MNGERKPKEKTRKLVLAAVGLCFGAALLLFGSFGGTGDATSEDGEVLSAQQYREELEATLTALCSSVQGAGKVTVFVTLSGGYEYVYSTDERGKCVTVGSGSGERAVVESVRTPEIRGVGIVCSGSDDPRVAEALCNLVCTTLGIGSNRVFITTGT